MDSPARVHHTDARDPEGKGCLIANSTTELLPGDPALKDLLTAHQREMEQLFVDFLRQGVERGQIAPTQDLPTFANLLYTLMTGLRVVGKTRADTAGSLAAVEAVLSLLDG